MRRRATKRLVAPIAVAFVGFALFAYFVPFVYVGYNSPLHFSSPPPASRVYASLSCALFFYYLPAHFQFRTSAYAEFRHFGTVDQGSLALRYSAYYLRCYPNPVV